MKFIRFGDLKAFRQKRYKKCPDVEEYPHAPPRPRGFFAFPYGFYDPYFMMRHPACNPNSEMSYLHDKNGRRLTYADMYVDSETEVEYDYSTERWVPKSTRLSDADLLRQLGLPTNQPIFFEDRPSWVCVMKDPANPPRLTEDGSLNQEFEYLLDEKGERIHAESFFWGRWCPDDFSDGHLKRCELSDINSRGVYRRLGLGKIWYDWLSVDLDAERLVLDYLGRKGIGVERLFAWPVYKDDEQWWLTVFKKPHIFSHTGYLWHHLRRFVPSGSVLAAYGTTWVYTTVRDFGRALRHVAPHAYEKRRTLQAKASRFGGPRFCSSSLDLDEMFEVFFDAEDIKKIT